MAPAQASTCTERGGGGCQASWQLPAGAEPHPTPPDEAPAVWPCKGSPPCKQQGDAALGADSSPSAAAGNGSAQEAWHQPAPLLAAAGQRARHHRAACRSTAQPGAAPESLLPGSQPGLHRHFIGAQKRFAAPQPDSFIIQGPLSSQQYHLSTSALSAAAQREKPSLATRYVQHVYSNPAPCSSRFNSIGEYAPPRLLLPLQRTFAAACQRTTAPTAEHSHCSRALASRPIYCPISLFCSEHRLRLLLQLHFGTPWPLRPPCMRGRWALQSQQPCHSPALAPCPRRLPALLFLLLLRQPRYRRSRPSGGARPWLLLAAPRPPSPLPSQPPHSLAALVSAPAVPSPAPLPCHGPFAGRLVFLVFPRFADPDCAPFNVRPFILPVRASRYHFA